MIFDTHAHYDDEAFEEDREALLLSLPENGVKAVANMGASWRGVLDSQELARKYDFIYAGAGVHPDNVAELNEERLQELREFCKRPKTLAVGEIGLDYHWMIQPKEIQQQAFILQLKLAKEVKLPVNIHSRDAAQDTFDIMKKYHAGTTGGIIHCYSGSAEMAREYVKLGYCIGVGGVVTFKNARVLKEVVQVIPLENIVLETDCPYMAPTPFRGKRNSSLNLTYVVNEIARLKEIPAQEVEDITWSNACRVYGLKNI